MKKIFQIEPSVIDKIINLAKANKRKELEKFILELLLGLLKLAGQKRSLVD